MSDEPKVREVSVTEEVALGLLGLAFKLAPSLFELFMAWRRGESADDHPMLPSVDEIIGKVTGAHVLAEELRVLRDAGDKL